MHAMIDTPEDPVDPRDLLPYTYPDLKELREINLLSVPLGSYIPWSYENNTKRIIEELGWEMDVVEGIPKNINTHAEKIECFMQGSRDYIKFLKRGYSRVSQINAFKVRQGLLTPAEAQDINDEFDGRKPESLGIFLDYVGLTEESSTRLLSIMLSLHMKLILRQLHWARNRGILIIGIERKTTRYDLCSGFRLWQSHIIVTRALAEAQINFEICHHPENLASYDRAILPGVGAFGSLMKRIESENWTAAIRSFVKRKSPLLGICVGMQHSLSTAMRASACVA